MKLNSLFNGIFKNLTIKQCHLVDVNIKQINFNNNRSCIYLIESYNYTTNNQNIIKL